MRYVSSVAAIIVAISSLTGLMMFGQGTPPPDLSITTYSLVSEERVTRSQWYLTYRADLMNIGPARTGVAAVVTSLATNIQVVPGRGVLHFGPISTGGRATSIDTFTVLVDRSSPTSFRYLSPLVFQWSSGECWTRPDGAHRRHRNAEWQRLHEPQRHRNTDV